MAETPIEDTYAVFRDDTSDGEGKELAFGFLSEHVYNNISKVEAEANSDMIWDEMHKLILEADIKG